MTIVTTLPNGLDVHGLNRNETEYLYKEILEDETYLPPGGFVLPEHPVIFDVGANIGMFALFANWRRPDARLFCFEPVLTIFAALDRNVGHLPNVTTFAKALGGTRQTREITFYPRYSMMSGFDADPAADKAPVRAYIENVASTLDQVRRDVLIEESAELLTGRFEWTEIVSCAVDRLASVATELAVDRIDLLKVDVEGFEFEVLEGIGESWWPRIGNAAIDVEDDNGELAAVTELCTRTAWKSRSSSRTTTAERVSTPCSRCVPTTRRIRHACSRLARLESRAHRRGKPDADPARKRGGTGAGRGAVRRAGR